MAGLFDDPKKTYSSENLLKIPADQLQVGMFVAELDRPWLETPFLVQGFEIRHRSDVAKIKAHCDHVYVLKPGVSRKKVQDVPVAPLAPVKRPFGGENKGQLIRSGPKGAKSRARKSIVRPLPFREPTHTAAREHATAREIQRKGKSVVTNLLKSAQVGGMLDTQSAEEVVVECVESIVRNPDAMIWMSKVKHEHAYTAEHCLNVCILAIAFGRHLNFSDEELMLLGICGLLHDVGKMKVPKVILDKPGELTGEELQIMREHTVAGHKLLTESLCPFPEAIDVAGNHHERPDGQGYPNGIEGRAVSEYARIIAVVDAYDAMTSDRCYSRAQSPVDAQKIIYEQRGKQFDEECALQFMQAIGPYPPGTWVELKNGMVGIVLAGRRKFRHLPSVILVLDGDKAPCARKIVDLHLTDSGELDKSHLIQKTLKDGTYGLRLEEFRADIESDA